MFEKILGDELITIDAPSEVEASKLNGTPCALRSLFNDGNKSIARIQPLTGSHEGQDIQICPTHLSGFEQAVKQLTKQDGHWFMRDWQTVEDASFAIA